ncbi:MAG: hypothetical protein JNM28_03620 [Armatimonadetes bacterium]|nr:hypothetical protein [Armatimonadota bacterium]
MAKEILSLFAAGISISIAFAQHGEWVQYSYTESDTWQGGALTLNPGELNEYSEQWFAINLTRTIPLNVVYGAVTEEPAWVTELTPLCFTNQTLTNYKAGIYAPNGLTVSNIWHRYDREQVFIFLPHMLLSTDGMPMSYDYATRNGYMNESFEIYHTVS